MKGEEGGGRWKENRAKKNHRKSRGGQYPQCTEHKHELFPEVLYRLIMGIIYP